MILQNIECPDRAGDRELYYRSEASVELDTASSAFHLKHQAIRFDTYFNAFSLRKWRKHTGLGTVALSMELKGDVEVTLLRHGLAGTLDAHPASWEQPEFETITESAYRDTFHFDDYTPVRLDYPDCGDALAISFEVRTLSGDGASMRKAAYCAGPDAPQPTPVNLALAICTYKREAYVTVNMDALRAKVFDNPDSPLHGHVQVYIADNGRTLDADCFDGLPIHIYPNRNSGGSGGFSRAAMEAVGDEAYSATHVILMDDDISFNIGALERTRAFLSLLRPEYRVNLLGGGMLSADCRYLLHAAGEEFTTREVVNRREDWDLRDFKYALLSETDIPVNYYAWWYCCIPVPLLEQKQYAMPLFVQFDDIEFSLRCAEVPKISLNGICCWHDPLEHKETDARFYYNSRNITVINALYTAEFTKEHAKRTLRKDCIRLLFTYEFNRAHMIMRGIEDFLKGVDWLIAQDPDALNQEIIGQSDRILPAEQLPVAFDPAALLPNKSIDQNPLRRRLRWLLLNGWLLPAKRCVTVVEKFRPPMQFFFRAGPVVKYDAHTGLAIYVRRSYREAFRVLKHLRRTLKAIDRDYDRACADYRARHDEIVSRAFWERYLELK